MNKQKWIVFAVSILMIGSTFAFLSQFKTHQKLGKPGVKATPIAGSPRLQLHLPENLPGYEATVVDIEKQLAGALPADTSFIQKRYVASDGFFGLINIVLMGTDRTSIHKPQFCLTGSGWNIEKTEQTTVKMSRPHAYELPVMKLTASREVMHEGQRVKLRSIYVYWFVADKELTAVHGDRMWRMAKSLLQTGELQRWAYITYFSVCMPGQEDATFDRMKEFMALSVPEFQVVSMPPVSQTSASVTP